MRQAATELGVTKMTIWRWVRAGRFTACSIDKQINIPRWQVELEKEKKK